MLKESMVNLDKYEEALNSKRRKRSETSQRSGGISTAKVGRQNPKMRKHMITHGSEDKYDNVMKTRHIQTSLDDVQIEDIPSVIQQSKKDRDIGNSTVIGNVRIEEKTRRILAGGEGLDEKVKKRFVGSVYIRDISGDGEKKDDSHSKLNMGTKYQGIRSKFSRQVGGIKHGNDQKSVSLPRENMDVPNLRAMAKANERASTPEDFPASSPNSNVKGKVSRGSRTSMFMELDLSVVHPPSGACSGSSIQPMTQWIGQRPEKSSRPRRAIGLPPISRKFEFTKESDITSTTCQLPKSAGSGENETREKGTCSSIPEQTERRSGSLTFRIRKNKIGGSEGDAQELGKTGADSSSRKLCVPSIKEKLENIPSTKPQQSTKPSDKCRSKSDRPLTKQGHRFQTHVGQKSEMREDLFQECNADDYILGITHSLGQTGSDHVIEVSTGALSEKNSMQRLEKATPLYQRVLSALLEEDEAGEPYQFGEIRNMPLQYASDYSIYGSCNQIDVELKERDRMDSEVESDVDLQSQKIYLDRLSCDKSVTSNMVQTADSNLPGFSSTEVLHKMMSLDKRLLVELHSIGLYPETLPDLLDGDEAINEDIIEHQNRLNLQGEWKRKSLGKFEKATENEQDAEKQKMEQAALDQLIGISDKKQLACRRSNASKNTARKGSKQVALAVPKHTPARCRRYDETGKNCCDELAPQSILSSPSVGDANDAKSSDCLGSAAASNKCIKALQVEARKFDTKGAVSIPTEGRESRGNDLDRRLLESNEGVISSSELLSPVQESLYDKERREVPTKDAIGDSEVLTPWVGRKKRSERYKHHRRDHAKSTALSIANQLPVEHFQNGRTGNAKLKQKGNPAKDQSRLTEAVESTHQPTNQLSQIAANPSNNIDGERKRTGNSKSKDPELNSVPGNLSPSVLYSMDELDAANGLDGHQDLGSWLALDDDGLLEHDSFGLAIPMDDVSEILWS